MSRDGSTQRNKGAKRNSGSCLTTTVLGLVDELEDMPDRRVDGDLLLEDRHRYHRRVPLPEASLRS
jgi:hypothetical protein